jgi:hypothetical protein
MNEAIYHRNWARRCRRLADGALSRRIAEELLRIADEFEADAVRYEWAAPTATCDAA